MTQQWCADRDFPTSTFKLKAAAPVRPNGGEPSPEASPGRPVLPMLDSRWSMLGAGCTSSVSTGVCVGHTPERFYSALPNSRQTNRGVYGLSGVISHQSLQFFFYLISQRSKLFFFFHLANMINSSGLFTSRSPVWSCVKIKEIT